MSENVRALFPNQEQLREPLDATPLQATGIPLTHIKNVFSIIIAPSYPLRDMGPCQHQQRITKTIEAPKPPQPPQLELVTHDYVPQNRKFMTHHEQLGDPNAKAVEKIAASGIRKAAKTFSLEKVGSYLYKRGFRTAQVRDTPFRNR